MGARAAGVPEFDDDEGRDTAASPGALPISAPGFSGKTESTRPDEGAEEVEAGIGIEDMTSLLVVPGQKKSKFALERARSNSLQFGSTRFSGNESNVPAL